jgi:hypothetical protein
MMRSLFTVSRQLMAAFMLVSGVSTKATARSAPSTSGRAATTGFAVIVASVIATVTSKPSPTTKSGVPSAMVKAIWFAKALPTEPVPTALPSGSVTENEPPPDGIECATVTVNSSPTAKSSSPSAMVKLMPSVPLYAEPTTAAPSREPSGRITAKVPPLAAGTTQRSVQSPTGAAASAVSEPTVPSPVLSPSATASADFAPPVKRTS